MACSRSHSSVLVFAEQLYPFGRGVGDVFLTAGVAASPETAPPLTLEPSFRFFGRDEGTLYVSYIPYLVLHFLLLS